ncbi:MAG TPA: hypothetical protein VMN39_03165, partial [Longimicrobiaceae bacterium]|nr:hypothetical protein [Longimicrobiaceae bacterium]
AEVERCIDTLREIRDRDARAALAETLVAHVESESRNEHRPEVFHRANRLFVSITRGRYELRLEDTGEAAFRAYDTQRARSQPLDELSSATRIQLLLAVRIAFVEVQEGRVRLPLLMDETLANSDADRAAAIMDAVLTLAADGRQVFYFTAQPDEVRKWQAALANHPAVSSKIFDLGEVRRLQKRLDLSDLESATQPAAGFPAPEGPSHAAYGALLHVPSVDVLAPAGALHLWYLFESPEPLHRAIATLGTDTWGGFKVLVENGATGVLPPDLVRKVEWLGIAAEAALRGMCTGRGRSLDRHALLASGAVSDTFIDEVVERCRSFDGDAARLLEALEARAVPKFLQKKIDALREFCLAEGYLDPREPLQPEKIRVEVIREVTPAIERREIGLVEVDRLLRRLGIRLPDFHANQRPELDLWKDPADGPRHRGDRSGFPRENSG